MKKALCYFLSLSLIWSTLFSVIPVSVTAIENNILVKEFDNKSEEVPVEETLLTQLSSYDEEKLFEYGIARDCYETAITMLPLISDDYTPDEKYEILKIAATGFFSLSEAESLYNRFPNLVIRDKTIESFEDLAALFNIESMVNENRLLMESFNSNNRFSFEANAQIAAFDNGKGLPAIYVEIGSDSETIVYSEAAKQRFLQMTSVNIYEIIKDRFLAGVSLDVIKNTLYSEAVSEDPIETVCQKLSLLRENNDTATLFSSVDNSAGISLLSFNSEAVVDTSIYSPFQINVNTNESINLQYGQVSYEQAVLSLPGKNGMDINLKIKYDTSRASQGYESADDVEFDNSNNPFMIGDGWYFDLPHIYKRGDVIYIPQKGNLCFNRVYTGITNETVGGKPYGYHGKDIYHETCYYAGNKWWYIDLPKSLEGHANSGLYTFAGNYYYADSSKVLCETDRFENIILYQYSADNIFNKKLLSKIVDTNNRVINFVYNEVSDSKYTLTISIEGVTNNNFTVNFSKHVNEDANGETYYLVDSICNQEQETTSFDYTIAKRKYSIGNNTLSEQVYNYTNLLTKIKYPTGIETRYAYQKVLTNNLFDKDYNDEKSVVQSKVIVDGETEYAQTNYTYYSRDESTEEQSDLEEKRYGRYVKVSENNGVFKEIKFSLDRRSKETIYNADGSVYEICETEFQGPNVVSQIKKKGKNITNLIDASYLVADMPASTKLQKDAPSTSASITRQYKFVYEYSKQEWSWNTRKPLYALQKKSIWYDDCHQLLTHNTLDKKNKLVTQTEVKMYDSTTETSTTLSRVDYEYDECGNMTKKREYPDITNSNDYIETQITYQDNTLPISISVTGVKDADGNLVNGTGIITETYVYDDLGRMIASTDGGSNTKQYTYDKVGRLTSVSFPDGTAQTYVFDTPLSKTTYTDRSGNTYIYQYTNIGLLDTITDPNENILCDNDYDNRGRLIRSTNAENASSYSELTYTYDDHDRVVKKTVFGKNNEYLTSENYQYDTDTNSVTTFYGEQTQAGYRKEYNKYDELIGEYTISGEERYDEKSYTYDRFGRLTNETGYGINNTYVYDALDNLVGTTDILNNQTSLSYDSLNRLLSSTDAEDNTTTYRYDSLGRTIETRTPVETAINGSLVYSVQKQYYDNNSNLTRQAVSTNENGGFRETLYTYDVMNRLVSTQTGNIVSTYTYTNADKIATQTVGESTTTYLYDILGHLSAVTDALGQTEHYTYDANNLLVSKIDRNGSTFTYTYDALGRIVSQAVAGYDGTTSNRIYLYDAFGNLLSQQEDEITISYTYDTINRLLSRYEGSTVETEGQPERVYQTFSYIPNTSVIQSYQLMQGTAPRVNVTYTYDDAGRLTRVDENGSFAASYTYNARGLNTKVTYGNGISTSKTYTQGGQLRNLTVAQTNKGVLYSETNKYGSDGNLTKKSHGLKYKPTYTDTYTYDASGMLATEKRMEETTPIYSYVYTYDTRGNRVGLTDNVNGETSGYTYDLNNRLLTLDKTVADIRPYSSLTSYYYDPNGNTVSSVTETLNEWHGSDDSDYGITEDFGSVMDGYAFTLNEYDVYNRLTHVKNSEHDARYTYNPDNLRRTKTVDGNTETFLWNPASEIVATIVDNSVQNTYVYGLDRILGVDALGTKTYYQQNGHHDTLLVSDKNGNTVSSYVYDAFGTQLNSNANDTNPFRYTGEYFDSETGFIYLRARYMDPQTGRFISEDPVGDGVNWYVYATGNPVMLFDPSGLSGILPDGSYYITHPLDRQLLELKQEYDIATPERQEQIAREAQSLRDSGVEGIDWSVRADRSLAYYTIDVDVTEKLDKVILSAEAKNSWKRLGKFSKETDIARYIDFALMVKPGAKYDLKSHKEWQGKEHYIYNNEVIWYDEPGNILYGYLGKAMGFEDEILKAAGGFVQILTGTSSWSYVTSYFDDPRDQAAIQKGIDMYKETHFLVWW